MITMRSPPQPLWIRKPWHIFVFLSQTKAILMRPPLALRPNWIGPEVGLFSAEIQSSSKSLYFYDVARMWRCDEKVRQTCDATRQWGIQSRQDWKKKKNSASVLNETEAAKTINRNICMRSKNWVISMEPSDWMFNGLVNLIWFISIGEIIEIFSINS